MVDIAKIVSLRGGEIPPPLTPRPAVIEVLEKALEMARAGEVIGIAVVFVHSDDATSCSKKGAMSRSMVGLMECLKLEICDGINKDA